MGKVAGRTKHRWIAGAIEHPGALRRALGIPKGKRIPLHKLEAAAAGRYGPTNRRRALLALRLRSY